MPPKQTHLNNTDKNEKLLSKAQLDKKDVQTPEKAVERDGMLYSIPEEKLSPMMQQYRNVKQEHKDQILFFRLGDFYEMFFDDAKIVSRELQLTLTGKECGLEDRAPMCGVPYHSCEAYIGRLIKKGYKVVICDQVENPAAAKGLVKRDVVRIITPGTVLESNMLEEGANNYICSLFESDETDPETGEILSGCGLAFSDISTGEIHVTQLKEDLENAIKNELSRFHPVEVLFNDKFVSRREMGIFMRDQLSCCADLLDNSKYESSECESLVLSHFKKESLDELDIADKPQLVRALGALLGYLYDTQRHGLESLQNLDVYNGKQYMTLDLAARRNLELTQTMRAGEKRGSLLWVLDHTKTAMGKRLLKAIIKMPLVNPTTINKRLNAVSELISDAMWLSDITVALADIFDLERLITRIVFGNVTPRELKSLQFTAEKLPTLRKIIERSKSLYLKELYNGIDTLEDMCAYIGEAIADDPPVQLKDGNVIRAGFNQELDELRNIVKNTKSVITSVETKEREKTGIRNLKIGFNNVFGYYIEVTKSFSSQVPQDYIRKQTLTGSERYITQELKELEQTILGAGDKILLLESKLYDEVRKTISAQMHRVQKTANAVAWLDVYTSFANTSAVNGYCCPSVDLSGVLSITEGRHPVVEQMLGDTLFVSNDTLLDQKENLIAMITGPNMAGKSTYMRQTALIVLMAQIGCFVPAKAATIGVVDGIFTRVGASDDLASGQSTFMVEMSEVAQIMKNATSKSLLILDEIGRGTSTFDGMSIARAVIEYIANKKKLGAKTLFATHYHELTELEEQVPGVKNYNIAVKKNGDDIIFLRRIIRGGTDDSYGIYVSRLAGIPEEIVNRAQEILEQLEKGSPVTVRMTKKRKQKQEEELDAQVQMRIVQADDSEIIRRLKEVEVDAITPIQAMVLLAELKTLV